MPGTSLGRLLALNPEPRGRRIARRTLTVGAVWFGSVVVTSLLPALLLGALAVDALRRDRLALTRSVLCLWLVLACEAAGILACLALWLWAQLSGGTRTPEYLARNAALQTWWCSTLYRGGTGLLSMRTVFEGDAPGDGPLIVLMRHASTLDTLLPVVHLARDAGFRLRFVLKRELLVDPCLDLVGHRLPNVFVRRGADKTGEEVTRVVALLEDLKPREAVVLFPEGTRFTPRKRADVIARLAEKGPSPALALAESLTHTLSPLRQGALALLRENPGADLYVLAHTGLEPAGSLREVFAGALVGGTVRVRGRRIPASQVPAGDASQAAFLGEVWLEVDRFVRGVP